MAKIIDSEYAEIPGPHESGPLRELAHVYRGRFCFRLGAGVRCGADTKFEITSGEKRTLQLSVGATIPIPGAPNLGAGGTIEYEHTFAQDIGPWPLEECSSIFSVLCFDDAEVRVFRTRRPVRKYALSAYTERFIPRAGDYGWAYPNIVWNDPFCDCHHTDQPSSVRQAKPETIETAPEVTIVRPDRLQLIEGDPGAEDDPATAAEEAASAVEAAFEVDQRAVDSADSRHGIVRADGVIVWLDVAGTTAGPNLLLLRTGVPVEGRRGNVFGPEPSPLVVVGASIGAASCEMRVFARQPGTEALDMVTSTSVPVQSAGRISAAWFELNFGDFKPGTTGIAELELKDADGAPIGYPVREPFAVDLLATAREREHA